MVYVSYLRSPHRISIFNILLPPSLLGKKITELREELGTIERYLDTSGVFKQGGPGLENNLEMWMRSFSFKKYHNLKHFYQMIKWKKLENIIK
jgi:hypothetical protein